MEILNQLSLNALIEVYENFNLTYILHNGEIIHYEIEVE